MLALSDLPALNASLNATTTVLLLTGYAMIRSRRVSLHRACMTAATVTAALFFACYLYYHAHVGSKPFPGQGWIRPVYFAILISHTALAAAVVPLALTTLVRGLRAQFPKHRRIARWTLPIWLYVSVTGVVIYLLLYRLY